MSVGAIADGLAISQPQVSKHLRVLSEVGLVRGRAVGRRRLYRLNPTGLRPLGDWVAKYELMWNERLGRLATTSASFSAKEKIRPATTRSTMTMSRHGSATFKFTDRTVTIQRRLGAPMALVFDAMAKPEHIRVWFPADDVPLHICESDLRVNGKYHYARYAAGDKECSFQGTFLEIERPTRVVATWLFEGWPDDEAIERVVLTEDGGITTMTDILEFKAPENLGDHFQENDGAQASWDKLDDLLADLLAGRP